MLQPVNAATVNGGVAYSAVYLVALSLTGLFGVVVMCVVNFNAAC